MRQPRRFTFASTLIAVLVAAALMTACGGGGGGPAPKPTIPTETVGTAQRLVAITTSMPTITTLGTRPGTATGKIAVNVETGQIGGSVLYSGLTSTATGASIHLTSDDSIVVSLQTVTASTTGAWTIPAGRVLNIFELSSLTQGGCYFQLETQSSPEKRGTIVFPNITITTALAPLEGNGSTGAGQGNLTINLGTGALTGSLTFSGLTSNATEAHIMLRSGSSSDDITLTGGVGAQVGAFTVPAGAFLSTTQLKALVNDGLRFVVNSENFPPPSGELIGTIAYPVTTIPNVALSGNQEVPPVTTVGSGTGSLTVNLGTGRISGSVIFNTPSIASAAHIHQGFAGEAGSVLITLTGTTGTSGTWTVPANTSLNAFSLGDLISNRLYINIHTASNTDGEIRGQIVNVPTN